MIQNIHLHRIGSDPEFVFVEPQEFEPIVVPAHKVVGGSKAVALASFIGTDNHQATAEIRPRPAHNVYQHLYDIASAVADIASYLQSKKHWAKIRMLARPRVGAETMGGHIHISFLVDEPYTAAVLNLVAIYSPASGCLVPYTTAGNNTSPVVVNSESTDMHLLSSYASACGRNRRITTSVFRVAFDHLLLPFERWVQPWWNRQERNTDYGVNNDSVRWAVSVRPNRPPYQKFAYLHYEYRVPSTWLAHPRLAYCYLALAKYTALNWMTIQSRAMEDMKHPKPIPPSRAPANDSSRALFNERFAEIEKLGGKRTTDLEALEASIKFCDAHREEWFSSPTQPIDIYAWRRLLV